MSIWKKRIWIIKLFRLFRTCFYSSFSEYSEISNSPKVLILISDTVKISFPQKKKKSIAVILLFSKGNYLVWLLSKFTVTRWHKLKYNVELQAISDVLFQSFATSLVSWFPSLLEASYRKREIWQNWILPLYALAFSVIPLVLLWWITSFPWGIL